LTPTLNQISKIERKAPYKRNKLPGLLGNPQKKVLCLRVDRKTPRKPNSAMRRIAIVGVLANLRKFTIFIPGDAAPSKNPRFFDDRQKSTRSVIQLPTKNNVLLMQGGGPKDLPGVYYRAIRGAGKINNKNKSIKYNLKEIQDRINSRSRYGASKKIYNK